MWQVQSPPLDKSPHNPNDKNTDLYVPLFMMHKGFFMIHEIFRFFFSKSYKTYFIIAHKWLLHRTISLMIGLITLDHIPIREKSRNSLTIQLRGVYTILYYMKKGKKKKKEASKQLIKEFFLHNNNKEIQISLCSTPTKWLLEVIFLATVENKHLK